MIITILAEPRSGSTTLGNWFYYQSKFTTLFEPISSPTLKWYKNGECPTKWTYSTKHLCVKETYRQNVDYSKLLSISDKVIILYRENDVEQLASLNNARTSGMWHSPWKYNPNEKIDNPHIINDFNEIKMGMQSHYINNPNYFTTTYENLYNRGKFDELLNYIDIRNDLTDTKFPIGSKYAHNITLLQKVLI